MQDTMDLFSDDNVTVQSNIESPSVNTPVRIVNLSEEEDSPYFPSCTQETHEDVDVLWDWNSPQSKPKATIKRRSRKRLNLHVPKEDMRILKEEIARPDHEESLILSPREEAVFKADTMHVPAYVEDMSAFEGMMEEEHCKESAKCLLDNVFNDDLEDQLILCSQRLEIELCDESKQQEKVGGVSSLHSQTTDLLNDTLEKLLAENETDFDQPMQLQKFKPTKNNSKVFPRSNSENICSQVGKFEWHRTQSFENYDASISKDLLEEIERKRLEAKAKLEAKRKHEIPFSQTNDAADSKFTFLLEAPLKCSQDEIEKKRLQALAKLEAKRQQDLIQKKKLDALKRLEQSRRKNALSVKHSLSKKL
ncbi:hypothetical protein GWI33_006510 [Rhynchophorus ferrugineus]|uniref:Uncharacterized protein n=1 Tax=Rhynchophorus ferrugineus TaxID=354439 RepID=A0A834IHI9_RHYFE|nr:hypothetical protein GWI33_006510 [Rhynchophorus ferrugineus]